MKRTILLYGLSLGTLIIVLKIIQYRFLVHVLSLEIYLGTIAILFTALGVWAGLKLTRTKTVVIAVSDFQFDPKRLEKVGISKREYEVLELFKVGILITLIASLMYCIAWEICYNTLFPDFMEMAGRYSQEKMQQNGATKQEMATALAEFQQSAESYKNPMIRFAITFIEIFPIGLIITLISAALLRRKAFLPAE